MGFELVKSEWAFNHSAVNQIILAMFAVAVTQGDKRICEYATWPVLAVVAKGTPKAFSSGSSIVNGLGMA